MKKLVKKNVAKQNVVMYNEYFDNSATIACNENTIGNLPWFK